LRRWPWARAKRQLLRGLGARVDTRVAARQSASLGV
jgi:hypothetical protein